MRSAKATPPALEKKECVAAQARMHAYVEGRLAPEDLRLMNAHLVACSSCYHVFSTLRHDRKKGTPASPPPTAGRIPTPSSATSGLNAVLKPEEEKAPVDEKAQAASNWSERLGGAPWWMISVAFHVLLITLMGLITMTIGVKSEDPIVVATNLERAPKLAVADEQKKPDLREILESKHDTPATDPTSMVASDIVVPPDILAKAELSDHFETINPDRPDTHSAFGNPDARMFHSASGNDEAEGGGGTSGATLLEEMIGVGGAGSPGTGGGWGGGNGTGTGIGNGAGHGSFGQRTGGGRKLLVMKHGGGKATESAVEKALEWLAKHQDPDGSWDYVKYHGATELSEKQHHCALTGLAVLAFLGAGHSPKAGKYCDNVRRALYWLEKQQDDKGCFGPVKGDSLSHNIYDQGICTLAMAEAGGMSKEQEWKDCAQKGIHLIEDFQNEYGGWRYARKDGDSDTSVVGWMVMALKSAKIAGLKVDTQAFQGALNFVEKVSKTQGTGSDAYTETIYRPDEAQSAGFETDAHSTTAIGSLIMLYGGNKADDDKIKGGCNYLLKKVPAWDKRHFYYWYYGTLCMFQAGGDGWKTWNEAMKKTLVDNQRKGGDEDGSWDSDGDYYGQWFGGRVYTTALGALCLEVYYRYLPLYR